MPTKTKEFQKGSFVRIAIPKQKIKRHLQRSLRRFFYIFVIGGIMFFCILSLLKVIDNTDFSGMELTKDGSLQALRPDLKFDIPSEHFNISFQFNIPDIKAERIDWHNYAAMAADRNRSGPGEHGAPTINTDETKKELEKQLIKENHFNGFLSNIISVNRSVPPLKMKKCLTKQYLRKLPNVSIVISCRNEHYSVLQRTLHSIYNRTPRELLKEIIIVDDHSHRGYSVSEMMLYVERNFPNLVKFIKLPQRKGLMYVRSAGAKVAKGDVIVFLDSHIECNHNWLPPLLEPIAINDRICTTPIIDNIYFKTFEYTFFDENTRGGVSWDLLYTQNSLKTGPNIDETVPYKDAVMMGGLFAISRTFFWKLGGYDLGLNTWGSENTEISFKIWMCGGMLLVVPCSHVGHLWIVPHSNKVNTSDPHIWSRNMKRIAEVWLDEYKYYMYSTQPDFYYNLNAGDLSEAHAVRKRLNCKSFKWYLDFVAPDFNKPHPFDLPPDFANGTIQSAAFSTHCLDTLGQSPIANVGLFECANNRTNPHMNQLWNYNNHQEIKNFIKDICLDMFYLPPNASVSIHDCTGNGGNQFWYYDKNKKWLVHKENGTLCLEAMKFDDKFQVVVNKCDEKNQQMQWIFGFVNKLREPRKYLKAQMY